MRRYGPRPKETPARVKEYLRRNLYHASACGVDAGVRKILGRLLGWKRFPRWLARALEDVSTRAGRLPAALAEWRDAIRTPNLKRRLGRLEVRARALGRSR